MYANAEKKLDLLATIQASLYEITVMKQIEDNQTNTTHSQCAQVSTQHNTIYLGN